MSKKEPEMKVNLNLGLFNALTVLFVYFKATGQTELEWWIIFSPVWAGYILEFCVKLILLGIKIATHKDD